MVSDDEIYVCYEMFPCNYFDHSHSPLDMIAVNLLGAEICINRSLLKYSIMCRWLGFFFRDHI